MAFNKTKRNLSALREAPEETRITAASRLILIVGAVVVIVWLLILLPLQLVATNFFFSRDSNESIDVTTEENTPGELGIPSE